MIVPTAAEFSGPRETLYQWFDDGPDRDGRRSLMAWRIDDGTVRHEYFERAEPAEFLAAESAHGRTTRQIGPAQFFARHASPSIDTCPHCGGTC
ncbi:hypothetical protein [Nocardia nova]|uniref:hypothetical protein n=1 Tax=Nocardia nova TaxID=37330 RepID=UPI0033ECC77C